MIKFEKEINIKGSVDHGENFKVMITNDNLTVKIDNKMRLSNLGIYLLKHSPILSLKVKTGKPYKIDVNKDEVEFDGKIQKKFTYNFKYADVIDGQIVEKTEHIIDLYSNHKFIYGEINIPVFQFILLMEKLNYIRKYGYGRFRKSPTFNQNVSFIEKMKDEDIRLKEMGYVFPSPF